MKLTNKEMIFLAVFLSIAIMIAGAFVFVLPEYEAIEPNKSSLQAARDERDRIYSSLAREGTIDQEIQDAIDQANKLSLSFYDDMTTYEADVLVREILEATNMTADSLSINSFAAVNLTVSDYVETVISYPLKEYSGYRSDEIDIAAYPISYDEEGKIIIPDVYLEKYGEEQALTEYLTALLSTQSQTVGAITVTFTINGTRGNFLSFLNYVAALDRATYINSTTIAYTGMVSASSTNESNASSAEEEGEEGEEAVTNAPAESTEQLLDGNAEISAPISMTFYCIAPMQAMETEAAETEPEPESDAEPAL